MRRILAYGAMLIFLSGCVGSEKGIDAGWGFDAFNTQSKEDKENEQWFKTFYGKNHCHGQWAGECKPEEAGSGGFWGETGGGSSD